MEKRRPSLPANRDFVVQMHTDVQIEQGDFKGRVEHLVSHEAEHFASLEELRGFISRILTAQKLKEVEEPEEAEERDTAPS